MTTTTQRSLGLRRHAAPPAPVIPPTPFQDQVEYGLHRGLPRRRVIPAGRAPAPIVEETAAETVVEFIEPIAEIDTVIEGVETAAPVAERTPYVDPNPDFFDWDGELVPMTGPYTSRDWYRWMHGVPAFLHEDRPRTNIR